MKCKKRELTEEREWMLKRELLKEEIKFLTFKMTKLMMILQNLK
jgi:hypothetical protein